MTEAEAMLTVFKTDLNQGRMDAQISAWGKDLLSNTRLLLDSPAAQDPVRRKLLQDLELVLVPFRTDGDGNEVVTFAFRPVG